MVHLLHLPAYYAARAMYVGHRLVINCRQFPLLPLWIPVGLHSWDPRLSNSLVSQMHMGPRYWQWTQWGILRCMSYNFLIMLWSRSETHDQIIIPAGRLCNGEGGETRTIVRTQEGRSQGLYSENVGISAWSLPFQNRGPRA